MADALEKPAGKPGTRIKCVLLQAEVPTAEAAFIPSTELACGQRAAAMVITISLTAERIYIDSAIRMRGHSRSGCCSTSLRHNLRG